MRKSRTVYLAVLVSLLALGCSRNKDLENLNREQARVIADLNQQVSGLQQELDQMKSAGGARAQFPVAGAPQKSNYIK